MPLSAGTKLGPYEIVAPLGAGGMGEVYRAKDARLGRDVAVKILPRAFASDPDRQRRFEAEARAAGALNHPNIVTLYDVGSSDGVAYLVTEVLEGETLRSVIERGALPPLKAAALLQQAALGLAAAHAKGIVHRDLKPENLFVLPDGRVKILDFGIAKLVAGDSSAHAETTPVFASMTASGTILGTVSYMAPEQLRDQPVDHRADLFAMGAILYEMVSGRLAFPAETAADRVTAILSAEPKPIDPSVESALPGIGELVRRCLEKRAETRFESARDLAYALEILAKRPAPSASHGVSPHATLPDLRIRQLTFRDGAVTNARFAPDGVTVIYRAAWEGESPQIYLTRTDNPDYQPLRLGDAELLAVSSTAELLIGLSPRDVGGFIHLHTLARVSMLGGVPRELARDVFEADWGPGGRTIAAIREVGGRFHLEYPLGKVLHETSGWLSNIRVSPDGRQIAFFEHPTSGDNAGNLCVIDSGGGDPRTLVPNLNSAVALAWHPKGQEIWYSASSEGQGSGLVFATGLDGRARVAYQTLGWPHLHDFSTDGDMLVSRTKPRLRMQTGTRAGANGDRLELSWLDWGLTRDITPDGSLALFDETGPGVLHGNSIYVRATDGAPAVRIGDGVAMAFMPDLQRVLGIETIGAERSLSIYPLGVGELRRLDVNGLVIHNAFPLPDGRSAVITAHEPGKPAALYRVSLETGAHERITNQPISPGYPIVSPDGTRVVLRLGAGEFAIVPLDGSALVPIPGLVAGERPCSWSADGTQLFTFLRGRLPCEVHRVDLTTGVRERWLDVEPMNRSGCDGFISMRVTPDGERYIGSFTHYITDLFDVGGLT